MEKTKEKNIKEKKRKVKREYICSVSDNYLYSFIYNGKKIVAIADIN